MKVGSELPCTINSIFTISPKVQNEENIMEEWSRTLTLLLLDQRTAPSQYLGEDAPTSMIFITTGNLGIICHP